MLDQLQHLARVRGCTHLVLEVAENNELALAWYKRRNFYKLDAAIFMAQKVNAEPELLPPRKLRHRRPEGAADAETEKTAKPAKSRSQRKKKPQAPKSDEPQAESEGTPSAEPNTTSH
jgi:hypothetical protein